jgi:type VI protein secretion system component VasK
MMVTVRWLWANLKRVFISFPVLDLIYSLIAIAAVATIAAMLIGGRNMTPESTQFALSVLHWAVVIGVVLFFLIVVKTWLEYRRRTYEPTLIFQFQKEFDLLEEKNVRADAAKVCMRFLENSEDSSKWKGVPKNEQEKLEPVLDFFEDLGFYLSGDQFSDKVAHHHFFHVIRGWYSNLESYIKYYRKNRNQEAAYENIQTLYERVARIEKKYERPILWLNSNEEKLEFLKEECPDPNPEISEKAG